MELHGRRVIYTEYTDISRRNVVEALRKALPVHEKNKKEIDYLYKYYRGDQPILNRVKDVRPEINNKIVENRANEIVSFKVGYLVGEPIQYVSRGSGEDVTTALNQFNEYTYAENKALKDKELADWFTIGGTAYRIALPNVRYNGEDSPFRMYTLDPRQTFVVYSNDFAHRPVMGVSCVTVDNKPVYTVYTANKCFTVINSEVVGEVGHILGMVPIIEYPANLARLGAFEIVIPLLDAINTVASNRIDGVEQFVQALMMFKGVDIGDKDFQSLKDLGAVKVPPEGDIKYLIQELNQTQTQTLVDDMYQTVLTICGMPNRNGGTSTSDTGSAVIMRDGWSAAEARAKDTEVMFKRSEKEFLKLLLEITNTMTESDLTLPQIEIRFTRRNYENILEKAQVLTMMLENDSIADKLAFQYCNMFADPELAYRESMKEKEENIRRKAEELAAFGKTEAPDDV
ncbi:MAG: phage portal protein [Ruminococcus sp.]|nr:phage portal protein [Ruminococcus sp.]